MRKLICLTLSVAMVVIVCIAGSVTTFAVAAGCGTEADPYVVSTFDELKTAIDSAPENNIEGTPTYIRINADFSFERNYHISYKKNIALDLNGHTLITEYFFVTDAKLDIKNGMLIGNDSDIMLAKTALIVSEQAIISAKGVTFLGGNGTASGILGGMGLYIYEGCRFQIEGCTITSGNSNDKNCSSALYIESSVGSISNTKLTRGSGIEEEPYPTLYIICGTVTDGDSNFLYSSDSYLSEVVIPPSAAATPVTENGGSKSFDIKGTYQAGIEADTVYSVDIAWGSMEFTYTGASEGTWNPETHKFEGVSAAAWSCDTDANKITVTNHSNTAINANFTYVSEVTYSAIKGSFTNQDGNTTITMLEIATGEDTTVDNAPKAEAFLKLDGALSESATVIKIGTVTVKISD